MISGDIFRFIYVSQIYYYRWMLKGQPEYKSQITVVHMWGLLNLVFPPNFEPDGKKYLTGDI